MLNRNNHIIIEGLWGIGKTEVAKMLQNYNYSFFPEPMKINNASKKSSQNVTNWFLKKHREREKVLINNNPIVLERSELSTFAYLYSTSKKIPSRKNLLSFSKLIKLKKILIVYLTSKDRNYSFVSLNNTIHGNNVKVILKNYNKLKLYDNWYKNILPYCFGITIFPIPIMTENNRKTSNEIVSIIRSCIKFNRVGQINIVVCRFNLEDKLEILILKRKKNRGGFWQTITGGIHIGESLMDCATREIKEELSISEKKIISVNFSYSFIGSEGYVLQEYVFTTLLTIDKSKKIKLSDEHEEYKWVKIKTANSFLKFKENKKAVILASRFIKKL